MILIRAQRRVEASGVLRCGVPQKLPDKLGSAMMLEGSIEQRELDRWKDEHRLRVADLLGGIEQV
ncbi:MAG: hypothetical protein ABSH36_01975 [Solirubrobacteraceae bacterium]